MLVITPGAAGDPAPSITPVISGTTGANGWYTSDVTVNWVITPLPKSSSGCDAVPLEADTPGRVVECSAVWGSPYDTSIDAKKTLKIDQTPPSAAGIASRPPDANGWYNHGLSVAFSGADATSGIASCSSASYAGPDNGNASVAGFCTDNAGNVGGAALPLAYDATPPAVSASADRAPDANGWYNHALSVTFSGTDATSGVASCTQETYSGPDNGSASVSGTCRDRAGNQSGSSSFPFAYDANPPTVSKLSSAAGNRLIDLTWAASADTQLVHVTRTRGAETTIVYNGKATRFRDSRLQVGAKYHYTVTASDAAGNSASKTVTVVATGALLSPVPGARMGSAPLLRWTSVKGARYYNVQLLRGGRTILSAWPTTAHFKVSRSWVFKGHHYRLHRGVYRWYVWPGFGRFSASKYGRLLGGSSFVFAG
jgi:hypothetical protein